MNTMEIISLILNFVLASGLLGTVIFFNSKKRAAKAEADLAEIENTDKIVLMQSQHIDRLDVRVAKLEDKVDKLEIIIEKKDSEINRKKFIIRQAYKCEVSPDKCPVLIKKKELTNEAMGRGRSRTLPRKEEEKS